MALEFYYTSARNNLTGAPGFSVVAVTGTMEARLMIQLELLSGYKAIFKLEDPRAGENPVSLAHWRPMAGGRYHSVLSLVRFAGADYSGRSNKFAYHLVLDPAEQTRAGPGWLIMQPGVMKTEWTEPPRKLPPREDLPDGENRPAICHTWQRLAGDAGWAGALVDAFLLDAQRPAYVIYPLGTDPLPLINEAISLLPESKRWLVTFNSYFTDLPGGLNCSWRFCVAGTEAAEQARRLATSGVLVDLQSPAGSPRDSAYVELARTGRVQRDLPAGDDIYRLMNEVPATPPGRESRASGTPHRGVPPAATPAIGTRRVIQPDTYEETVAVGRRAAAVQKRGGRKVLGAAAVLWPLLVLAAGWMLWSRAARTPMPPPSDAERLRFEELTRQITAANDLVSRQEGRIKDLEAQLAQATAQPRRAENHLTSQPSELTSAENPIAAAQPVTEPELSPPEAAPISGAPSLGSRPSAIARVTELCREPGKFVQYALGGVQLRRNLRLATVEPPQRGRLRIPGLRVDRARPIEIIAGCDAAADWPFRLEAAANQVALKYRGVDGGEVILAVLRVEDDGGLSWEWQPVDFNQPDLRTRFIGLNGTLACSVIEMTLLDSDVGEPARRRLQLCEPEALNLELGKSLLIGRDWLDAEFVKAAKPHLKWIGLEGWTALESASEEMGLRIRHERSTAEFKVQLDTRHTALQVTSWSNRDPGTRASSATLEKKRANELATARANRGRIEQDVRSFEQGVAGRETALDLKKSSDEVEAAQAEVSKAQKEQKEARSNPKLQDYDHLLAEQRRLERARTTAASPDVVARREQRLVEIDGLLRQLRNDPVLKKAEEDLAKCNQAVEDWKRELRRRQDELAQKHNDADLLKKQERLSGLREQLAREDQRIAELERAQQRVEDFKALDTCHVHVVVPRCGAVLADIRLK